ncbi:MAG: glycosyltransferase [Chloroflexi bacterium]|nr:glycosyltransferase [Chloroflexota bacterium]
MIKVLYDGWPLVRLPNTSAGLHLHTILERLPEEVQAVVALPEEAPEWFPSNAVAHVHPVPNSERAHLGWEQRDLSTIAKKLGAKIIHITSPIAPFFSDFPVLVSPTGFGVQARNARGVIARLRTSIGRGGSARATGMLWPSDLLTTRNAAQIFELPPTIHPGFTPVMFGDQESPEIPGVEMPETYTLYHGPGNEQSLRHLLKAWTWAAGPIGEYYPLLLLGLDAVARQVAKKLIAEFNLKETVRIMPSIKPRQLAALFQNCSALYHPANISPWGGPVRHALACARPVVAFENPDVDAVAGSAAFLVPPDDLRAFGAAMISVVIKENIYEALSDAAEKRVKSWDVSLFADKLLKVYRELLA